MSAVEIYNGRVHLGHIVEQARGKRWTAYDAAGQPLGVFAKSEKAVSAVCEAARQQQREAAA